MNVNLKNQIDIYTKVCIHFDEVTQSVGKKVHIFNFINILSKTCEFEVLLYDSNVVPIINFHSHLPTFAIQLRINVDFHLYLKRSVS